MQSSLTPTDLPSNANNSPAPTQFTSNDGLSWGAAAAGGAAAGNQATSDLGAVASNTSLRSIPSSNEPAISIPSDGDSLRFPLPVPEPITATPVATAQLAAASAPTPSPMATAAPAQTVMPVAYLAPAPGGPATATLAQLDTSNARSTGPWRSPQFAAPSSGVTIGVPTVNQSLPNSMDVRLRRLRRRRLSRWIRPLRGFDYPDMPCRQALLVLAHSRNRRRCMSHRIRGATCCKRFKSARFRHRPAAWRRIPRCLKVSSPVETASVRAAVVDRNTSSAGPNGRTNAGRVVNSGRPICKFGLNRLPQFRRPATISGFVS